MGQDGLVDEMSSNNANNAEPKKLYNAQINIREYESIL